MNKLFFIDYQLCVVVSTNVYAGADLSPELATSFLKESLPG